VGKLHHFEIAPELGKSWMILDICIAAASSRYTLGSIKPMQGDVLYLALEDSERRLQSRIDKLLPTFGATWPDRMTIVTRWRRIDAGGIDDLKEWCDSVKEPVMVVIDVFTKVRPSSSKTRQQYEADYDAVGMLQEFANERSIAVVLVHHDRKMEAEDPFDTVSGTHGITGAADTILILKRTANGVTLHARGRDIEEAELAVQLSRDSCKWTILGQAAEVRRSDERSRVIVTLKKANGPMSVKAIMATADLSSRNAADILLFKMATDGQIERVGRGQYALPSNLSDLSNLSNLIDLPEK
jgi:RecA-family ATPase